MINWGRYVTKGQIPLKLNMTVDRCRGLSKANNMADSKPKVAVAVQQVSVYYLRIAI